MVPAVPYPTAPRMLCSLLIWTDQRLYIKDGEVIARSDRIWKKGEALRAKLMNCTDATHRHR